MYTMTATRILRNINLCVFEVNITTAYDELTQKKFGISASLTFDVSVGNVRDPGHASTILNNS